MYHLCSWRFFFVIITIITGKKDQNQSHPDSKSKIHNVKDKKTKDKETGNTDKR